MASAKLRTPDELKAVGRHWLNLSDADVAFFSRPWAATWRPSRIEAMATRCRP